jgi:hypothetical protein
MKRAALAVNKKSRRGQNGGKRFGFLSAFHLSLRNANGRRNGQPLPPVLGRIRLAGTGDVHVGRERKTCTIAGWNIPRWKSIGAFIRYNWTRSVRGWKGRAFLAFCVFHHQGCRYRMKVCLESMLQRSPTPRPFALS